MPLSHSRPSIRRPLAFSRLRTAHDSTMRSLVSTSWDTPSDDESTPTLHHHHHHHHHHHVQSPFIHPRLHTYSHHHSHNHSHTHSHSHSHTHSHRHHYHHPCSIPDDLQSPAALQQHVVPSESKSPTHSTLNIFTPNRATSPLLQSVTDPSTSVATPPYPVPLPNTHRNPSTVNFPVPSEPVTSPIGPTTIQTTAPIMQLPPSSANPVASSQQASNNFIPGPPLSSSPSISLTSTPHHAHTNLRSRRLFRRPSLHPRAATDVSGAAIHAAHMAELAARDAADASAAARAAASYARTLMSTDVSRNAAHPDVPTDPPCPQQNYNAPASSEPTSARGPNISGPRRVASTRECPTSESPRADTHLADTPFGGSDSIVGATSKGRGVVRPVPLGKVWSFDLVALWHNAIRLELRDLDDIVWGLVDTARTVTVQEIRALFAWFSTFEAFVVTSLKAEEEVLFPWVEQWGRIEGDLSTASRITTKGTIIRGIRDTAACAALVGLEGDLPEGMVLTNPHRNYYDTLNVGLAEVKPFVAERKHVNSGSGSGSGSGASGNASGPYARIVDQVASHVASFSLTLLDYFEKQERSLPVIIDSLYDEEDMHAATIERQMLRALWKCGRKDESMVMLMRAVEQAPFHRAWVQRNVKRVERFAMPVWRRRYSVGRGAITTKFRERYNTWERNSETIGANIGMQGHGVYTNRETHARDAHPHNSSSASLSLGHYSLSRNRSVDTHPQELVGSRSPSMRLVSSELHE